MKDKRILPFRLAWRNLWRNPRRSLITVAAIAAAYAFVIALIGLLAGLSAQMLENGTVLILGHMQVHHGEYLPDRNVHDTLEADTEEDLRRFLSELERDPAIEAVTPRVHGFGLISTGEYSAGAQLWGVDPAEERRVTTFLHPLEGAGLLSRQGEVILGSALARELNAAVDSEVAIVTQAADGTMGNELYRVRGLLHTGLRHLDRSLVVLRLDDLQELLALDPNRIHEIALRIDHPMAADDIAGRLNAEGILPDEAVARSWGTLAPQLRDYLGFAGGANAFIISIVALFSALGVLNTMMMAVFERTREFGMLTAMGMRPATLLSSVLLESLYLAGIGLAIGFAGGAAVMLHMTTRGWDLTRWMGEMTMMDTRVDPVIHGVWVWDQILWAAVGLALATLIASFLPARRSVAVQPVQALNAPAEG
jgi:ABC-type lipoprotein release transport system permease subunit